MNLEDIKIGMKVVPHSKLKHQLDSEVWNNCIRKNQPYMYVISLDGKDSHTIVVCGDKNVNIIFESLNKKAFEDFTDEENKLYSEALDIQYSDWYSTIIKEVDIDADVNVYI